MTQASPTRGSSVAGRSGSTAAETRSDSQTPLDSGQRFIELALLALETEQVERGKLVRFLHDEVAPVISTAGLQLDILRMDLEDRIPGISSRTAEIQDLLERVVRHIRDLIQELNRDCRQDNKTAAHDPPASASPKLFPSTRVTID